MTCALHGTVEVRCWICAHSEMQGVPDEATLDACGSAAYEAHWMQHHDGTPPPFAHLNSITQDGWRAVALHVLGAAKGAGR